MLRRVAVAATVVLVAAGAVSCDGDDQPTAHPAVDTELTIAQLFGVVDDVAVVAAHPSGWGDFPLWIVNLRSGEAEAVLTDEADFVLSAAIDAQGRLAMFDGSSPTRLLVAELEDGTYSSAEEIGTYDLDSESGAMWLSEHEVIFAAARPGEEADLYLVDLGSGDLRNLTNTPRVFESSPALLRSDRDAPVVAFIAASVVGNSDVPDYGPSTIEFLELVDGEAQALSVSDLGMNLDALRGQTLELVRSCPATHCLVAFGFDADRNARSIWCVGEEARPVDLPPGIYRSPVALADGGVAAVAGEGRVEVTSVSCG